MTIIIKVRDGILFDVISDEPIREVIVEDLDVGGHVDIDGNEVGYTDFAPSLDPAMVEAVSKHYERSITERLED